jgi:DNA-binding SARP family transcriptional activator
MIAKTVFLSLLISLSLLTATAPESGGGLLFHGLERPIDERSSLVIKPGTEIRDSLSLDLLFKSHPAYPYGQILRITLSDSDYSPVLTLMYDGWASAHVFRAIWDGHRIMATSSVPGSGSETPSGWIPLHLCVTRRDSTVILRAGDEVSYGTMSLPEKIRPVLVFGRDKEHTDVPSMAVNDLKISLDGKKSLYYPLDESRGNTAYGEKTLVRGKALNPVWISRLSFHWQKQMERNSAFYQTAGYNPYTHDIYTLDRDSLILKNIGTGTRSSMSLGESNPVKGTLGTSFIHPSSHRIVEYELFYPVDRGSYGPVSMASLDPASLTFEPMSSEQLPHHMHHHNCVVDTVGNRIIVFGGFGGATFNGDLYSFSLDSLTWRKLPKPTGAPLWPRFQGSMGLDGKNGILYIYGGVGNESGEQVVGRQYFYTLHSVDLKTGECVKRWEIPWKGDNTVAVRDMVLDGDGHFYTLLYTESKTESVLNLYRFNIDDGSFEIFADPVPIYSDKINCQANLYFDPECSRLVAIVEESVDSFSSTIKAYTLDFPPQKYISEKSHFNQGGLSTFWKVFSILALIAIILLTLRSFLGYGNSYKAASYAIKPPRYGANSLQLFGEFTATGRNGEDITSSFSGKIRQLLMLIMEGQDRGGVTALHISNQLWPEKEYIQAKNIRGVTVNNLRKALSKMDGIELVYSSGRYLFSFDKEFRCDYIDFLSIMQDPESDMDTLLGILSRGNFIQGEKDPLFDKMNSKVESMTEPVILSEMASRYSLRQYQNAILCANILFKIDPLNEEALKYTVKSLYELEKTDEARQRYKDFVRRYGSDYKEEFKTSFDQLLSD